MGKNIKIEFELPDFNNEITIQVTIKKDGEVLQTTSSTSIPSSQNTLEVKKQVIQDKPKAPLGVSGHPHPAGFPDRSRLGTSNLMGDNF